MKNQFILAAIPAILAGCGANSQQAAAPNAASTSAPVKLTATQELSKYCRVCVVDKGEKIEEYMPSRLDTKRAGKTYKFCTDGCKKKFDANEKRYALK